jgi:hypothetical protein
VNSVKSYFASLVTWPEVYLKPCRKCGGQTIRWGYYLRLLRPSGKTIRIQRVRCKGCGRTEQVLPAFLLARKHHLTSVLTLLARTHIDSQGSLAQTYLQTPEVPIALCTFYRWSKTLLRQLECGLPRLKRTLLKLEPAAALHPGRAGPQSRAEDLRRYLKQALAITLQLAEAAVRLMPQFQPELTEPFLLLNAFLHEVTGKALMLTP